MSAAQNGGMPHPVTVAVYRRVAPDAVTEATLWVQAGVNKANKYPGFLGSGWIRAAGESDEWHMLYRFSSPELLAAWEDSDERQEWLAGGAEMVLEQRVVKRTGIEGWFDDPAKRSDTGSLAAIQAPATPPRWKQSVAIFVGFLPLNLALNLLLALVPGWLAVPLVVRVIATVIVLTPVMTYWVLPLVTRMLQPWLQRG
jgi:antibiotic biosynthesis monooxygenase (ABM) superfamily enzyme